MTNINEFSKVRENNAINLFVEVGHFRTKNHLDLDFYASGGGNHQL